MAQRTMQECQLDTRPGAHGGVREAHIDPVWNLNRKGNMVLLVRLPQQNWYWKLTHEGFWKFGSATKGIITPMLQPPTLRVDENVVKQSSRGMG